MQLYRRRWDCSQYGVFHYYGLRAAFSLAPIVAEHSSQRRRHRSDYPFSRSAPRSHQETAVDCGVKSPTPTAAGSSCSRRNSSSRDGLPTARRAITIRWPTDGRTAERVRQLDPSATLSSTPRLPPPLPPLNTTRGGKRMCNRRVSKTRQKLGVESAVQSQLPAAGG